jgi:phage/plasmid-like protein (TIGR03299 family)
MAHELSIRADGRAEMAFVGETPWHGLGQQVSKGASIETWRRQAGMDWEAKEAPVVYDAGIGRNLAGDAGDWRSVDSSKVLYRSDTGAALGIVGSGYNPVQPAEVLEFFRDIVAAGGWYIHTAGVLREGKKLWAMATNGQVDLVTGKKSDSILRQVLLATSLDGSMKTVAKPCATVVVCANTLNLALGEHGKVVTVSHRSQFDAAAVKRALGLSSSSFDEFLANARRLAETPIRMDDALEVLHKVFGKPAPEAVTKVNTAWMGKLSELMEDPPQEDEPEEKVARSAGRVLELFDGAALGAGKAGRAGTRWGLLNAITQHVDHEVGRTPDTRIDSAWFGRGDTIRRLQQGPLPQ